MIIKEANGKTFGFTFGTYTIKILDDLAGIKTIDQLFEKLGEADTSFSIKFYYACALHYAKAKKIEVNFDEVDIADFADDLGYEESLKLWTELIRTYQEKNMRAPKTGQTEIEKAA